MFLQIRAPATCKGFTVVDKTKIILGLVQTVAQKLTLTQTY